jgi:hypothetical protein
MPRPFALLVAGLAGCTNLAYERVPPAPPPPPTMTPAGVRVTVADERPKWERKPFRGAITLVGFGAITPPPWEQLRDAVAAAVEGSPDRPAEAAVTVRSFRLVVKDAARLAAEAERERSGPADLPPAESLGGFAANLFGQVFVVPVLDLVVGYPFRPHYPPDLLRADDGVTCSLAADVRLAWADGRTRTVRLETTAGRDDLTGTGYHGDAVRDAVRQAMANATAQARKSLRPEGDAGAAAVGVASGPN